MGESGRWPARRRESSQKRRLAAICALPAGVIDVRPERQLQPRSRANSSLGAVTLAIERLRARDCTLASENTPQRPQPRLRRPGITPSSCCSFNFLAIRCIVARVATMPLLPYVSSNCESLHRKLCGTATLFVAPARLTPSEEGNFRSRNSHIAKV